MAAFGLAETAELAVRISLKDDLSRGIDGLTRKVGKLQTGLGKVGAGLKTAARNLTGPALVAGGLLGFAIKGGLDDLSELESAVTSVDGAIKQMGLTGKITGAQVADMANKIEAETGAAFDDKAITQAATTLIRYGKVTEKTLEPALVVMTDLAAKTGDIESASTLLAKSLAAPEKAAGKLARMGIVLTKAQQKQIAAMVEAGDVVGAQTVLLDALTASTKGAADASQGKYKRAMSVLADVQEDARKALAEGFLPVLEKVAGLLSTELAKPQTLKNIREFGEGLAAGLDSLVEIAKNLPWGTIGDSLKIAGQGAKAILTAFTGLPPWVQTAVLTGWGLNKLTGGMLGDLAGGLIKGVLGMNAGVVNIKAGVVNGAGGGIGGAGGKGGGRFGRLGGIGGLVAGTISVMLVGEALQLQQDISNRSTEQGKTAHQNLTAMIKNGAKTEDLLVAQRAINDGIKEIGKNPLLTVVQGEALDELKAMRSELGKELERRARPLIEKRAPANAAANQASIASREGGGKTSAAELKAIQTKVQAGTTAIKNAQSIASRENSAQKAELGNIKNSIALQTNAQKANAVAEMATTVLQGSLQAARDAFQSMATKQAGTTAATASRAAGNQTAAAQSAAASRIVGAIWAARPVIQSTNVVNNYTRTERSGATADSRTRRAD